jgi:predicted TIM-barrel fold metal-dependent hydrolase
VGDKDFGLTGGGVIGADKNKLLGRLSYPTLDEVHPGSFLVKPRLKVMDDMGVHAQICYQNAGVTQMGSLVALGDNDLALAIIQMFNDAASERQVESNQRLFSMAILPMWDRDVMTTEARRCVQDLKLHGFTLPDRPEQWGVPGYGSDYWAGFFELCDSTRTPINFHLASGLDGMSLTWNDFTFAQKLSVGAMMFSLGNAATMGNFMVSGLLDTYPNLRICAVESGMGWVPFVLEALEHQIDEMMPDSGKFLKRRPKEYFRDQFWVTYWFEKNGPKTQLETVGVDKVLFETDFPHPTSLYPGIQEQIADTLGGYSHEVRRKVLETNAVHLYNLPF